MNRSTMETATVAPDTTRKLQLTLPGRITGAEGENKVNIEIEMRPGRPVINAEAIDQALPDLSLADREAIVDKLEHIAFIEIIKNCITIK